MGQSTDFVFTGTGFALKKIDGLLLLSLKYILHHYLILSLVRQSNETDVCDSTGNIFDKSNVSMDSAIGYHRTKM